MSRFITSSVDKYPEHDFKEIVVIGRSNVGKSSLINSILKKDLARTSQEPGKTQTLNFYSKEEKYCIVDVPGFGFAKIAKDQHASWAKMVEDYLSSREQLVGALLLIDSRRMIEDMEKDVLYFLKHYKIPYAFVVTKMDKLNQNDKKNIIKNWELIEGTKFFVSSTKGDGILLLEDFVFKNWIKSNRG